MRPRLSALLDHLWEQAVRTPQRFVVLSFAAAAVLLLVISAHGLVVLRDHEVQTLQQTQQLQVAGISSVLFALGEQMIPPTLNLDDPDPECDLDYVPCTPRKAPVRYALANCIGFGSKNSALVLGRV